MLLLFIVEVNALIYPGVFFYIVGTFSLTMSNFPLGQLFPDYRAIIMTLSYATFLLSGSTFRLWNVMFDNGTSYKTVIG